MSGRVADRGPSVYICAPCYREAAFPLSPPNTEFVWVAVSGDKMAISTISQAGISFQQLEGRRRSFMSEPPLPPPSPRLPPKIDWTETIRSSEREEGVEVCGIGGWDAGGKMDYLSDCWEGGGEVSGNRQRQNEGSKVNTPDDDDDEPGTQ